MRHELEADAPQLSPPIAQPAIRQNPRNLTFGRYEYSRPPLVVSPLSLPGGRDNFVTNGSSSIFTPRRFDEILLGEAKEERDRCIPVPQPSLCTPLVYRTPLNPAARKESSGVPYRLGEVTQELAPRNLPLAVTLGYGKKAEETAVELSLTADIGIVYPSLQQRHHPYSCVPEKDRW